MTEDQTKSARLWNAITRIRIYVTNILFLAIMLMIVVSISFSFFISSDLKDPEGKALIFNPQGPIVEQLEGVGDPLSLLLQGPPQQGVLVREVLELLESAESDERIDHIILKLENIYGTGQAVLFDVGQALKKLRESGKNIISVGDSYDDTSYYLASFSNEIILNPDGMILLTGFSRYRTYYKSFLDKLKITVNLFRVGKYKSAMEPYIRDDMSESAKEASRTWMGVLWDSWKEVVARNRNMLPSEIQNIADNAPILIKEEKGDIAKALVKVKLVDKLLSRTETRKYLEELIGKSEDEKTFSQISDIEYLQVISAEKNPNDSEDEIALIIAQGAIMDGIQPPGSIGGDSTAELIKSAHENEKVKAIVLRIDSGGGSAFASEVIREEIVLAKSKGIPVIASMSNVAASGGYWIAASANEIWSSHNTITGSIGIFGFFPTFEKSLAEIGIHTDGISTTDLGSGMDPMQGINPGLSDIIQSSIEFGYERFIGLVAKERKMTKKQVDEIAQGRVWAGETAHNLGLVDRLGNLKEAVNRAAELAQIENYRIYRPKGELDWKEKILKQLLGSNSTKLQSNIKTKKVFQNSISFYQKLNQFNDPKGIYAICLECYH